MNPDYEDSEYLQSLLSKYSEVYPGDEDRTARMSDIAAALQLLKNQQTVPDEPVIAEQPVAVEPEEVIDEMADEDLSPKPAKRAPLRHGSRGRDRRMLDLDKEGDILKGAQPVNINETEIPAQDVPIVIGADVQPVGKCSTCSTLVGRRPYRGWQTVGRQKICSKCVKEYREKNAGREDDGNRRPRRAQRPVAKKASVAHTSSTDDDSKDHTYKSYAKSIKPVPAPAPVTAGKTRNYAAMKDTKLIACYQSLRDKTGSAYDRCLSEGSGDPDEDFDLVCELMEDRGYDLD